ncbi:MAG: hypothetical protein Kow0090_06140 [Myxococcota bacterium]
MNEKENIGRKKMRSVEKTLSALAVSAILIGCGQKAPPPPPPPPAQAQTVEEAKKEEKAETPEEKELYFYTPIGKRDPYRPFYVDLASSKPNRPETGQRGPATILEMFELQQMKLVAVITGLTTPRAMVEIPDGRGFIVKPRTPIGKHGGRVVAIRRDSIVIEEEYIGTDGTHHVNQTVMELHKPGEEQF